MRRAAAPLILLAPCAMIMLAACSSRPPPASHPPPTPVRAEVPAAPSYGPAIYAHNLVDECDTYCAPRTTIRLPKCAKSTTATGRIRAKIAAEFPLPRDFAMLVVSSPSGCEHGIWGWVRGATSRPITVPAGDQIVTLHLFGVERRKAVRIEANETVTISFNFTREDQVMLRRCDCEGGANTFPRDYPILPRDRRRR